MINLAKSLRFALKGLYEALLSEKNFRLLWLCATTLFVFNYIFIFEIFYQIIFILLTFIILATELINSAIEKSCDNQGLEPSIFIKNAKDFAASAVLIMVCAALTVFFIIVYEYNNYIFINYKACIFIAIFFIIHFFLCVSKFKHWFFILILLALIVHLAIIFLHTGPIIFLLLSVAFHAGLIIYYSHIIYERS